jgi:hypothetical protein
MTGSTEGAIPPELYSTTIIATGSIYLAARSLPGTIDAYFAIPTTLRIQTIQTLIDLARPIAENRATIDTQFKSKFGRRLFRATVDDGRVFVDLSTPCENERDFVYKIQVLAGLITRLQDDAKELIRNSTIRERVKGPINVLEEILKDRFGDYDPEIISNLRMINKLRNKLYPTHTFETEAIEILEEMGFTYPPSDWNETWKVILASCSRSYEGLRDLLRTGVRHRTR